MTYQVDQSGKIEKTAQDTVLAYTNDKEYSILIPRKLKRQIQELLRRCGLTRLFVYSLFAVGVFYLLKDLKIHKHVIIDIEYPGKDKLIEQLVTNILKSANKPIHTLSFQRIGNKPRVHYAAKNVYNKKTQPDYKLTLKDVIKALKMADGRLRECLSTLVDAQPRPVSKTISEIRKKSRKR